MGDDADPCDYEFPKLGSPKAEDRAAELLGPLHGTALDWANQCRDAQKIIIADLEEVREVKPLTEVQTCFSETKRAYALEAGAAVFDMIDTDGTGTIEGSEIAAYLDSYPELLQRLHSERTQRARREWSLLLSMLDSDGDGVVDEREFRDFFYASNCGTHDDASRLFAAADTNDNGTLSRQEVKNYLDKNPFIMQQMLAAKHSSLDREWDRFFKTVEQGCSTSPENPRARRGSREAKRVGRWSRDDFAELWADSGLGDNPHGLGISNALGRTGRRLVPGRRASRASLTGQDCRLPPLPPAKAVASPERFTSSVSPERAAHADPLPGGFINDTRRAPPPGGKLAPLPATPSRPQQNAAASARPADEAGAIRHPVAFGSEPQPMSADLEGRLLPRTTAERASRRRRKNQPQLSTKPLKDLLREQDEDFQMRAQSTIEYKQLLQECETYNRTVLNRITEAFDLCTQYKVIEKWRRASNPTLDKALTWRRTSQAKLMAQDTIASRGNTPTEEKDGSFTRMQSRDRKRSSVVRFEGIQEVAAADSPQAAQLEAEKLLNPFPDRPDNVLSGLSDRPVTVAMDDIQS